MHCFNKQKCPRSNAFMHLCICEIHTRAYRCGSLPTRCLQMSHDDLQVGSSHEYDQCVQLGKGKPVNPVGCMRTQDSVARAQLCICQREPCRNISCYRRGVLCRAVRSVQLMAGCSMTLSSISGSALQSQPMQLAALMKNACSDNSALQIRRC